MANPRPMLKARDEILEAILHGFADNPFLAEQLILQGGGALHFFYGSPRYSTDLDFISPAFHVEYNRLLDEIQKPMVLRHMWPLKINLKTKRNDLIRTSYAISASDNSPKARVEIVEGEAEAFHETTGKYSPLQVEDPSQIYIDKIVATLGRMHSRDSFKPTDLYDLEFLTEHLDASGDVDAVRRKLRSRGEEHLLDTGLLTRVIDYIEDESLHGEFEKVLKRTMLPDVSATRKFNSRYFGESARHFYQVLSQLREQEALPLI
jgi:predicted nucleotidyltransferase component of viral defense system